MKSNPIVCTPKSLPSDQWGPAARIAAERNPFNGLRAQRLANLLSSESSLEAAYITLLVTKYWGRAGVRLTVGFLDNPGAALRSRILEHMNAWSSSANVSFTESDTDPQVRIAREGGKGGGYWSYVGTDILSIEPGAPTMNLEGFTMDTDEREFVRVVRHETGHTLGFAHEHMRKELVARVDEQKAIEYFGDTQRWSPAMVRAQVLTPLEASSIFGTPHADETSIMCYQIPAALTKDGKAILGGTDIDKADHEFAAGIYPKGGGALTLVGVGGGGNGVGASDGHAHRGAAHSGTSGDAVLLFAPGTSPAYVASVVAALQQEA